MGKGLFCRLRETGQTVYKNERRKKASVVSFYFTLSLKVEI